MCPRRTEGRWGPSEEFQGWGSHRCVSKVHDVIRHRLWGTDGEGGPRGGASRELVTGNKVEGEESGSDDEGTEVKSSTSLQAVRS